MSNDLLNPKQLVIPVMTTTVRNTLIAEIGTIIYDSTTGSMCVCNAKALGSWTDLGVN